MFFVLVVAAAEVVVGLGIIVALLRRKPGATADDVAAAEGLGPRGRPRRARLAHPGPAAGRLPRCSSPSAGASASRRPAGWPPLACGGSFVATRPRLPRPARPARGGAARRDRAVRVAARRRAHGRRRVPRRPAVDHDGAVRHRRRHADPPLLDRLHARRPGLPEVLRLPEPVRLLDALLVLGDNLLLTFLGWEGVGTCSYLLISFWFTDEANASAGKKAFVTNRIGDFGFMLAMFLAFAAVGTLQYDELLERRRSPPVTATAIALLLFLGACGKSAQLPLYVWLPDAMAGPTPVSALIHAATMVTAGVFLMTRVSPILVPGLRLGARRHRLGRRRSPRCSRPPSPSPRTTSRRCSPTRRSASSATCSSPSAPAPTSPPSSTWSPTPSSRRCSSSAPAR